MGVRIGAAKISMIRWIKIGVAVLFILMMGAVVTLLDLMPVGSWLKFLIGFIVVVAFWLGMESLSEQRLNAWLGKTRLYLKRSWITTTAVYAALLSGGYLLLSCFMPHSGGGSIYYEDDLWKVIVGISLLTLSFAYFHVSKNRPRD